MAAGCSPPCSTYIKPSEPPRKSSILSDAPPKRSCSLPTPSGVEPHPFRTYSSSAAVPAAKARKSDGGDTVAEPEACPFKQKMLGVLNTLREPLADHQAAQGLPKDEQYSFVELVKNFCTNSYQALLAIFTMLYNLIPFLDGFLYLMRFILDKLIEIFKSEKKLQMVFSLLTFLMEMIVVVVFVYVAITCVMLPVCNLTYSFLCKVSSIL